MFDKITQSIGLGSVFGSKSQNATGPFLEERENGFGQISLGGQYDFKSYQYPTTLGEKTDPHYMIFYINVDSQSKYIGRTNTLFDASTADQNRIGNGIAGSVVEKVGKEVSNFIGDFIPDFLKESASSIADKITSTDIGKNAKEATAGQFTKTMKRISRAIVLPVPGNLGTDYGINWETESLGVAAGLLDNASKTQAQEQMAETGKIVGQILGRAGIRAGAAVINNPLSQRIFGESIIDGRAVTERLTRSAINPRKEQLFKNVNFRKFNFSWTLVPKNQKEAVVINDILKELKFHMHPELDTGGYFYIYPSEFDIKFYFKGAENTWLSKISTCVLTDMKVSYTPNNEFVTYKDGMPDSIKLDLAFTELELLTKERIEKGF